LDDFAYTFYFGDERKPTVRAYTFDDVVAALDRVIKYDWRGFFEARVRQVSERLPLAGIENDGWRLDYTDAPSLVSPAGFGYSLGFWLNEDGVIGDVRAGSA